MTSASELFYTRRSRLGRSNPDLGFDRSSPSSYSYRRHHCDSYAPHHHRRDLGGGDPLRRSSHASHRAVKIRRFYSFFSLVGQKMEYQSKERIYILSFFKLNVKLDINLTNQARFGGNCCFAQLEYPSIWQNYKYNVLCMYESYICVCIIVSGLVEVELAIPLFFLCPKF